MYTLNRVGPWWAAPLPFTRILLTCRQVSLLSAPSAGSMQ